MGNTIIKQLLIVCTGRVISETIDQFDIKAYIPPECKIPGVGGWRWAMPPTPEFRVRDTNMLVSKM